MKAYGNAIVLPQATTFVASVIDALVDAAGALDGTPVKPEVKCEVTIERDPAITPSRIPDAGAVPAIAPTAEDDAA